MVGRKISVGECFNYGWRTTFNKLGLSIGLVFVMVFLWLITTISEWLIKPITKVDPRVNTSLSVIPKVPFSFMLLV